MPRVRCLLVLLTAVAVADAPLPAQQRFTSTTSLLTLDVSVLDRDGNPVTGLRPDDFVVVLNKETQPVRTMVFLATQSRTTTETGQGAPGVSPPPPSAATTADASREPDPRLLVILVDDLSIYPTLGKGLFVAAERFVGTVPPRDWVGLASTSGRITVNPSPDRAAIVKSLAHASGWMNDPRRENKPFVGFMDALEAELGSEGQFRELLQTSCGLGANALAGKNLAMILTQFQCANDADKAARRNAAFAHATTRNQLDTFISVINAMAPAPGVKQLVILTGGIALRPADSLDFVPLARAAAAAGVQMTIMVEEPDGTDMSLEGFSGAFVKDQQRMLQQAQTLADMSGGQFFRVIGQADRFFQRVLTSASAIYRIGIDLPKSVPSDGNYRVAVTVRRPGVRAFASRYAAPPAPRGALTPEEQMKHAITTGEPSYAVPLQMGAEVVAANAGRPTAIHVSIDVPAETAGPISGLLGVIGPDRLLRSSRHSLSRAADDKPYYLDLLVPATAGTYELRFAVADATGAVGAVTRTIVVRVPDTLDAVAKLGRAIRR